MSNSEFDTFRATGINDTDERHHVWLTGRVIAETPLAVAAPKAEKDKDKVQRLFRSGKGNNAPVFFPGTGMMGRLRRCLVRDVRAAIIAATGNDKPWTLETYFLNTVGGVNGFKENALVPGKDRLSRRANPLESVFGSARMAGKLGFGNLYPVSTITEPPIFHGVRANDFRRDEAELEYLPPGEVDRLTARMQLDRDNSVNKTALQAESRELKKQARKAGLVGNETLKNDLYGQANEIDDSLRAGHVPIANLFQGFEAIPAGTEMSHRFSLSSANQLEFGFLLASLRAFATEPRLGGHFHHGDCGWVDCEWQVHVRKTDVQGRASDAGIITISPMEGFQTDSDIVTRALAAYDALRVDGFPDLQFDRTEGMGSAVDGLTQKEREERAKAAAKKNKGGKSPRTANAAEGA